MHTSHIIRAIACLLLSTSAALAQSNALQTTGNVGIGTTSPQYQLHIRNSDAVNLVLDESTTNGLKYNISSRWGGFFTIWNETNPQLNAVPRIAINPNGTVGIGTLFPYGAFHVSVASPYGAIGNNNTIALRNTDTTPYNATSIINYDSSTSWVPNAAIDFLNVNHSGAAGAGTIRFYTKRTDLAPLSERLRIDSWGRVGIGSTSPAAMLDIPGNSDAAPTLKLGNTSFPPSADIPTAIIYGRATTAGVLQVVGTADSPSGNSNLINVLPDPVAASVMVLDRSGRLGLGTSSPTERLSVKGRVRAQEVIVETTGWADHVLAKDYPLASLSEVEAHIVKNGTLPGIPSSKEVADQGVSIGEMQAKLLEKVEEITLHLIALQKENAQLKAKVEQLEAAR
ncbi:MAG: hypothetical protein SFV32_13885 [Opitutaceae bacterium]|nr:hypothetical protein [Opitutaceae bacterium]